MKNVLVRRVLVYLFGIFVMAIGVTLSINSGLGITPMSSFPYVLSQITGLNMTVCMTIAFSLYVILQFVILGKKSSPSILIQLIVAFIFGFFTDFTGNILKFVVFEPIYLRIALSLIGTAILSLGLTMYIPMNLPPLPPEGLSTALDYKFTNAKFHHCKTGVDIASVVISISLSLIFLNRLVGIGMGTLIAAVLVGQLMPLLKNITEPIVNWAQINSVIG